MLSLGGPMSSASRWVLPRNWRLVKEMAGRQIAAKYKGSAFGWLWSVLTPLLMLGAYMFVFSTVFQRRWETVLEDKVSFALFLFAGICCHGFLAEILSRAPGLIIENRNYVKKIMFPLEVIPVVAVAVAAFSLGINLALLLAMYIAFHGVPPATALMAPIILAPLLIIGLGVAWLFSAIGVFLRDLKHLSQLLVMLLLFMTPIFYPIEVIPEAYRVYLLVNPLASIVTELRDVLFFGRLPSPLAIALLWAGAVIFAWLSRLLFLRLREVFADAI
ncbi:MAG: ABC transporter permease [Hyphomicrobium sp.]|nr:ABC transporter permease [Hyphomicrobium sp.]